MEQVLFNAGQSLNAFEAGRHIGRERQKENALMQAQKKFGSGDYKGASNDLFQYAPELAMKTANYGQAQQQQQARVQAGTQAAAGDLSAAAGTLAGQGDLDGWASLDGAQRERMNGMYDFGARVLYGLQGVPVEQRKQAALAAARNSPYANILVPQTEQEEDWSDARLKAGIAGAMSVQDMIKTRTDQAKLDQGDRRIDVLERGVIAKERGAPSGPAISKQAEIYANKQLGDAGDAADQARTLSSFAKRFRALNAEAKTGGMMNAPGWIGDISRGIGTMTNDSIKEMESITARIGPMLRQAGSGAMSDKDLAFFVNSVPNISSSKEVNDNIAAALDLAAENATGREAFMAMYFDQNGNVRGADPAWRRYLDENPIFTDEGAINKSRRNWESYFGLNGKGAPAGRSPEDPLGIR